MAAFFPLITVELTESQGCFVSSEGRGSVKSSLQKRVSGLKERKYSHPVEDRLLYCVCLHTEYRQTSQHPVVFPEHLSALAKMGFHESTQPFVTFWKVLQNRDHHCLRLSTQGRNLHGPSRILSIAGEQPVGLKRKGTWVPLQIVHEVREYSPKALSFPLSLGFLLYKMQKLDSNVGGHYVTCIPHFSLLPVAGITNQSFFNPQSSYGEKGLLPARVGNR